MFVNKFTIMKKETVICKTCGNSFEKVSKEVTRSLKLNRPQYCSKSCASRTEINIESLRKTRNTDMTKLNPSNRRDEFTGFREHLKRIKYRTKEVSLTLQDLKDVFESQKGICPYSKVTLEFVPKKGKSNPIYTISLDRKDSNIGYIKENIQFISIAMNHLKNNMSEENMQEILTILKTLN